jgi:thiamine-phosphate pyrophosphorylase
MGNFFMQKQDKDSSLISGVYAITPCGWLLTALLESVEAALSTGICWVQYRDKSRSDEQRKLYGCCLAALVRRYGAHLVINDSVALYQTLLVEGYQPAGCHLGKDDLDLHQARVQLGDQAVLGASCYGDLEYAKMAVDQGASYVALGALFPSSTKPQTKIAPLVLIEQAISLLAVPVVGIGGIGVQNIANVSCAGAGAAAVVSSLFGDTPDPEFTLKQAKRLQYHFAEGVFQRKKGNLQTKHD